MTDRAILACYAHPDDEQGVTGTLLRYGRQGVRTGLLCATRGEAGEISDPALATPETLGAVREAELRSAAALAEIGTLWFLDYRDSGMVGTDPNRDPRAFINADEAEAVGRIVRIVREFRPTILLTFDPTGGYGHPDHLAINRWTTAAFHAAGDPAQYPAAGPAWTPSRLYYASFPRSAIKRMLEMVGRDNPNTPMRGLDPDKMGMPDESITNVVEVPELVDLKMESLRAHATQYSPTSPFAQMPEPMMRAMRSKESFAFAAGTPLPADADRSDLFAGLD
ncbi:MAG: PIG-L family deacetylase [Chloroflexota bacterium]|nr:PIG-L family deacetylase [Chloroflexota bacterium]